MRREDLLLKLVTTLHLSVPERNALGAAPISVHEVARVVKNQLERNGVFPIAAKDWQLGERVFEGFFLVKRPHRGVRLTYQRHQPISPNVLADHKSWEYANVDGAISRFIRSEWSNGIDGIAISET